MSKKKERGWLSRLFGGGKKAEQPTTQADPTPDEKRDDSAHLIHEERAESAEAAVDIVPPVENEVINESAQSDPVAAPDAPSAIADSASEAQRADVDSTTQSSSQNISDDIHEKAEEAITDRAETADASDTSESTPTEATVSDADEATAEPEKKPGFFTRLRTQLTKTRDNLTEGFAELFLGKKEIDEEILEELETRLLLADVGVSATMAILDEIREEVDRKTLSDYDGLIQSLKVKMEEILLPVEEPLTIDDQHRPYVILMIGVNGVGKTTTIGKLAKQLQQAGKSVMLAAGDTFRAAAVEQLQVWGERNKIPVISQKEGADPASVVFDAVESAKARKVDILIADTAGRLHTDSGLMQELAKIHRVIKRLDETAPHEVMLVVDASTGQNALNQARQFNETVPLSGITFTKMDGTAKGGIIFAIADELKIPVRFIGVGEGIDDLRPFVATEFVDALIGETKS